MANESSPAEGVRGMTAFDAIIVGAGQAGPSLAGRLTGAGMKVALVERKLLGGTCVNTGCMPTKTLVASARAAHVARHAERWGVRPRRARSRVDMPRVAARARKVTEDARAGLAQWLGDMAGLTPDRGPCPAGRPRRGPGRRRAADGAPHLPQRRRAGRGAAAAGDRAGPLPHQHLDPRARHAAAAPRGGGRQLYRARIRADVPPLRRRRHRRREGPAPDPARGRGRVGGDRAASSPARASPSAPGPSASASSRARAAARVRVDCEERRAGGARLARPARDGPAAQHRRPRAGDRRRGARRARLHHRGRHARHQRPRHLGAGRLQRARRLHAHLLQRLRDRRRQPARRRRPPRERARPRLRPLHRPAARPLRHDGGAGARERPPAARLEAPDGARGPGGGEGRDGRAS